MATTTNYSWTTPDDTALVKDGAAAIRSLGTSIDTTTKALNPSTTLGDIEYRSSTANTNTRLPIGTNGQVLTVSGGVPSWATPAGGGKVLQVVQATYSTAVTTTSTTTYSDSGLSATITPSSSSSKVLILVSQSAWTTRAGNDTSGIFDLARGSTSIWNTGSITNLYMGQGSGTETTMAGVWSCNYLDSPATTSATTYKTRIKSGGSSITAQFNNNISTIILLEIGA